MRAALLTILLLTTAVRADEGLPELPETSFLMLKAREPRQPMTDMLAAQIQEVFGMEAGVPE